jgi:xanthine/CO dehydrogenase XdhC/CoxF family maturation factor
MKHHLETRLVLARLGEWIAQGVPCALATVLRVRGSAYRHEGAKMLVAADGTTVGNVSGGCLELDVREVALRVIDRGVPEFRRYCSGSDEIEAWDLGVGCEGEVEVVVEPARSVRGRELAWLEGDRHFVSCTAVPSDTGHHLLVAADAAEGSLGTAEFNAAVTAHARALLGNQGGSTLATVMGRTVFLDHFLPPPRLLIAGAGDDAMPLSRLATDVGFRVMVADRRPGLLLAERFPGARLLEGDATTVCDRLRLDADAFAVVMHHHFADDIAWLRALLASGAGYIGMLGPRQRTDRMLQQLGDLEPVDDSRVHGPVGLDIGTDGAEQVALAVLAELMTVRAGRDARSLRERHAPIHSAGA